MILCADLNDMSLKFKFNIIFISLIVFFIFGYIIVSTSKIKDEKHNYDKLFNAEFSEKIKEIELVKIDAFIKIETGESYYFEIDYSKFSMKESRVDDMFENIKEGSLIYKIKCKNYFTIDKNGKETKFFFK